MKDDRKKWFYIKDGGGMAGPLTEAAMHSLAQQGAYNGQTLLWNSADREKIQASQSQFSKSLSPPVHQPSASRVNSTGGAPSPSPIPASAIQQPVSSPQQDSKQGWTPTWQQQINAGAGGATVAQQSPAGSFPSYINVDAQGYPKLGGFLYVLMIMIILSLAEFPIQLCTGDDVDIDDIAFFAVAVAALVCMAGKKKLFIDIFCGYVAFDIYLCIYDMWTIFNNNEWPDELSYDFIFDINTDRFLFMAGYIITIIINIALALYVKKSERVRLTFIQ